MTKSSALWSLGVLSLASCVSAGDSGVEQRPLLAELRLISGQGARECGLVPLGSPADHTWECARAAEADGVAHWFAVEMPGIDSDVWIAGIRAADGSKYILYYDSNYMGGPDLLPRFTRETCKGQLVFDPDRKKMIQCLRVRPE